MAPPVITITRQYASGGAAVARQVAAALAWTVIDNEFVDEVARRADHRGGGGPRARGAGRAGGAGAAGAAARRVARLRRGIETVARQTRRGAAGRGPRQCREGGGRHGP